MDRSEPPADEIPEPDGALCGASFCDPTWEEAYRREFLAADGRLASLVAAVWLVAVLIPATVTVALSIRLPVVPWVVVLRALYLLGVGAFVVLARRPRSPAQLDALVLGVVLFSTVLTFAMHSQVRGDDLLFLMTDVLPVIGLWALMPNRIQFQALAAGAVSLRTLLILALWRDPVPPSLWVTVGIALAVSNALGATVSWNLHRSRRRQYSARRLESGLRASLEKALAQVRTLRGLVSMCAGCKAIRAPDGTWRTLEETLAEQTEAVVSHGFCEACLERLYPVPRR